MPLPLIYAEDVAVDRDHVLDLAASMRERQAAELTPQNEAVLVGYSPDFSKFPMMNGFHRYAALGLNRETEARAEITPTPTWQHVLDIRIQSAVLQKVLTNARLDEWVQQSWELTPWVGLISLTQAIRLVAAKSDKQARMGLDANLVTKIENWASERCGQWHMNPGALYRYRRTAELADPELVKDVRPRESGHSLDHLTQDHLDVIVKTLPNMYDLQNVVSDAAKEGILSAALTSLVASAVEGKSLPEAREIVRSGSWRRLIAIQEDQATAHVAVPQPPPVSAPVIRDVADLSDVGRPPDLIFGYRARGVGRLDYGIGQIAQKVLQKLGYAEDIEQARDFVGESLALFREKPFKEYKEEESLYHEEQPIGGLLVLREGSALIYNDDPYDGARAISEIVDAPSVLGLELLSGAENFTSSAEAFTRCSVQHVPIREMGELIRREARLILLLLLVQSIRKHSVDKRMVQLATKQVPQLLAGTLLDLSDRAQLPNRINQELIAELANCTRESANKHLKMWERRGIFSWGSHGGPTFADRSKLQAIYEGRG